MGENVLKGQVESFKKGSDRSLMEMATPTLFDRPDIMSTIYTAGPVEGCGVTKGDRLEARRRPRWPVRPSGQGARRCGAGRGRRGKIPARSASSAGQSGRRPDAGA